MIIEGKNAVLEAIKTLTINKLLVSSNNSDITIEKIINIAKERKILISFASREILNKNSPTKRHQGVIAFTTDFDYCEIKDIINVAISKNSDPFILILDGVEDPHNFGAIIRSAECAGIDGIIIGKHRACPVNETVIKTSAGAFSNVKIARVTNINQEIENLKKQNIWVYGAEASGKEVYSCNLKGGLAIVIGSEGFGISSLTQKLCDEIISLPLKGKINSLNASVACGAILFEAVRQREHS